MPTRTARTPPTFDAAALLGTWRVEATTFPMWLDGTRRSPRFTYSSLRTFDGQRRLDDRVSYQGPDGATQTIDGIDVQHPRVPTHFTWTGRGALAAFSSEWDVVSIDPRGRYALITFSPTLATPAGLDVIARQPLDEEGFAAARAEIEATAELSRWAQPLRRLRDR